MDLLLCKDDQAALRAVLNVQLAGAVYHDLLNITDFMVDLERWARTAHADRTTTR